MPGCSGISNGADNRLHCGKKPRETSQTAGRRRRAPGGPGRTHPRSRAATGTSGPGTRGCRTPRTALPGSRGHLGGSSAGAMGPERGKWGTHWSPGGRVLSPQRLLLLWGGGAPGSPPGARGRGVLRLLQGELRKLSFLSLGGKEGTSAPAVHGQEAPWAGMSPGGGSR